MIGLTVSCERIPLDAEVPEAALQEALTAFIDADGVFSPEGLADDTPVAEKYLAGKSVYQTLADTLSWRNYASTRWSRSISGELRVEGWTQVDDITMALTDTAVKAIEMITTRKARFIRRGYGRTQAGLAA